MCVLRLLLQNRKQQPWHVEEAPEVSLGERADPVLRRGTGKESVHKPYRSRTVSLPPFKRKQKKAQLLRSMD